MRPENIRRDAPTREGAPVATGVGGEPGAAHHLVQPIVDVGVVKLMLVGKQSIAVTLWNMATVRPLEHERQVLMQSAVQLLGASVAHASSHAAITGGSAAEYWHA